MTHMDAAEERFPITRDVHSSFFYWMNIILTLTFSLKSAEPQTVYIILTFKGKIGVYYRKFQYCPGTSLRWGVLSYIVIGDFCHFQLKYFLDVLHHTIALVLSNERGFKIDYTRLNQFFTDISSRPDNLQINIEVFPVAPLEIQIDGFLNANSSFQTLNPDLLIDLN